MKRFTQIQVDELNGKITTAEDALRWASENLHPAVAKASSFGAEDSVLIEMMTRVNPEFRFFTLDTASQKRPGTRREIWISEFKQNVLSYGRPS